MVEGGSARGAPARLELRLGSLRFLHRLQDQALVRADATGWLGVAIEMCRENHARARHCLGQHPLAVCQIQCHDQAAIASGAFVDQDVVVRVKAAVGTDRQSGRGAPQGNQAPVEAEYGTRISPLRGDDRGLTPLRQVIYAEVDCKTEQFPNGDLTALLISRGADVFELTASGYPADLARRLSHPVAENLLRQRMAEQGGRPPPKSAP